MTVCEEGDVESGVGQATMEDPQRPYGGVGRRDTYGGVRGVSVDSGVTGRVEVDSRES